MQSRSQKNINQVSYGIRNAISGCGNSVKNFEVSKSREFTKSGIHLSHYETQKRTLKLDLYSLKTFSMNELKITDTLEGNGTAAIKGALIVCQYKGFLEDGTLFDSSYDHGRPFQFVIGSGRVIKGWDQGLMGMKEGGKRTLQVPAHLACGERQMGQLIKPNSNLIFYIELLEVRPRE